MLELVEQQKQLITPITHIVLASCSGATQAGLVIGAQLAGFTGKIVGISIDDTETQKEQYQQEHMDLANTTAAKLGLTHSFTQEDFLINYDYAQGYGVVGKLERDAIQLMAQQEGILLDPVYTGRAFGALIDMIKKEQFSNNDNILFWHTGGSPALFTYATELTRSC